MEFEDVALGDVLKTFSHETGINVIAAAEVGALPVTIYLEDVEVLDALDQILKAGNLTYERPAGSDIYIVKPKVEEPTQTITRVYRLKYARASQSLLAKTAEAFGARTPFEATLDEEGAAAGGGGGGVQGTAPGVDSIIRELLTGKGDVVVDGRTNRLIITDVPENFPRLEAALAALDIRTPQIMVGAEVFETTLDKLKDLGFEWGTGTEGTLFQLTPARRTTRFPFSQFFGDQGKGSVSDPAITLGTMDSSQAIAVLQALETDTDTKILARPKVLTLDNESALIRLTSEETIGFETTSQATTGTTSSTPERETTGVVLVVTPQVNENDYITMLVEPSVTKTVAAKISPPSGQAQTRDPKTRSARTLVRIRSGDTLVVGGLIDRSDQESLRQVPILSGIPVIGEAFKNTEINHSASELIVFVTPNILAEPSETQVASAGQAPFAIREQEEGVSRQHLIEEALNRLE
jgi:type II secretory pathway component GspD/PulD (secretin)